MGGAVLGIRWWRRTTDETLLHTGIPVQAQVVEVFLNHAFKVNGRSPFRIVAQWHDPDADRLLAFESRNIWFDPSAFLGTPDVTVYLEPKQRRRYYMDTSFLPRAA